MCTNLVIMIMIIMASVVCVMMIIGHTHTHKSWSSTTFLVVVVLVDVVVNVINGESTIKPPQPSTTELVCTPNPPQKNRNTYRCLYLNFELTNTIIVVQLLVDHKNALDRVGQNERIVLVASLNTNTNKRTK